MPRTFHAVMREDVAKKKARDAKSANRRHPISSDNPHFLRILTGYALMEDTPFDAVRALCRLVAKE